MKFSSSLMAVGFLATLSVALPASTPTATEVNIVPASGTVIPGPAPTSAPTLMPRSYIEAYCAMVELGLIENDEFKTVTLNRTGVTRISRLKARADMKGACKSLREGKLTYDEYMMPPPGQTTSHTLKFNPWGDK